MSENATVSLSTDDDGLTRQRPGMNGSLNCGRLMNSCLLMR